MRLAPSARAIALLSLACCLVGCPEKQGERPTPEKAGADVERAEPDDDGKADDKAAARKADKAAPAAAPDTDKKADDGKDEGGW